MGAILAVVRTEALTFADIEAAWKSNPYITYNELAAFFDVSVVELMEVIDAHIRVNEVDPN